MGNGMPGMLQQLEKTAVQEKLWTKGDTIVAAVSGGPDSMALLHMLHAIAAKQKLSIVVAHVNHGFRAEESALEAELVRQYAARLSIPFEMTELQMPAYIEETRMNASAASRERRYAFLHEIASKYGAASIALAHHGDDQAETVLMRMLRGAGLTGLSGMAFKRKEKNVQLIRPLLRINKSDLLQYCAEHEVPYEVDSSNNERYYFRNVVRLDVLPYLSQFNPQLSQSLRRLADVAGAEDDLLERQAEERLAELATLTPGEIAIPSSELYGLHVALQRRLIKLILNYLSNEADSAAFEHIETMRLAAAPEAPSTWRFDAGAGIRCVREYSVMRWLKQAGSASGTDPSKDGYAFEIHEFADCIRVDAGGLSIVFEHRRNGDALRAKGRDEACFDASQVAFPLTVRNRRPGDRISVLGLNGSKKVQDMFVDEKIAPSAREQYPLIVDAEGRLLWIPRIRRSSHALAEADTTDFLFIRLENE
ncbi:tRNA lysidine(34) synthetase TilS [Paenibacillus sp. NEAU-GSW1]|uniref:tRNA lysidine(34) synthetase TilS n=1 Tax=Paenibacillus sp. NEAU-GSW1 TaxID=2682486 RepID=UPI0012E28C25|nr:tRNA lysidine(34) synthetase TilS [Paenibacillus sp. NEAU-GSW1]MUT67681.1 tRNA lysidine(34) synthetase TilS [Paenibacillus sp. NEAU-GSW1]